MKVTETLIRKAMRIANNETDWSVDQDFYRMVGNHGECVLASARRYWREKAKEFANIFDDETEVEIFRKITIRGYGDIRWQGVGIFWAWDEEAAEAHWGYFGNSNLTVTLRSVCRDSDVDWEVSLAHYMQSAYEGEKEIRLKRGTALDVEVLGEEIIERAVA